MKIGRQFADFVQPLDYADQKVFINMVHPREVADHVAGIRGHAKITHLPDIDCDPH
jgi:hypothetical protein